MLAKAQQSAALLSDSTVTLTFSSDSENPGSQLTFDPPPFVFVDEDGATVTVTLVNAEFVDGDFFTPVFPPSQDSTKLTVTRNDAHNVDITVETKPTHYLRPWALAFNINVNPTGEPVIMASPTLYIVRGTEALGSLPIGLNYRSDGTFQVDAAVDLSSLIVLVNPSVPFNLTFNLSSELDGVTFNSSTPIIWEGPSPNGVSTDPLSDTELKLIIGSAPDRLAAFRFVLDVPTSGDTITVTSPDPILVNATIGDG